VTFLVIALLQVCELHDTVIVIVFFLIFDMRSPVA
jgi:hypothetical protein